MISRGWASVRLNYSPLTLFKTVIKDIRPSVALVLIFLPLALFIPTHATNQTCRFQDLYPPTQFLTFQNDLIGTLDINVPLSFS